MIEIKTLPNGVRIVSEHMPAMRSASVGIWVGAGSRCEKASEAGSAHFIEHMLFKGTGKRSARELACEMDAIGGQCNAFTSRESTCFYARCLDSHLDSACELLADMFFDSLFDEEDVRNERGVVCEEIGMYRDTPEDLVQEQLLVKCFPGTLGRPVLGREATLEKMTGASLRAFKDREYCPSRVVLALAGSFTEEQLSRFAAPFAAMEKRKDPRIQAARYLPTVVCKRKNTEQNHFCLAWEGLSNDRPERFALDLLSTILGEGLSSRLFQTVREKYGLCYSIGTGAVSFSDIGLFTLYTATGRETEKRALELIAQELRSLREDGVSAQELTRAQELMRSSLLMASESTSSRMMRLGGAMLAIGRCMDIEERLDSYASVTREDILSVAQSLLRPDKFSFSALGRIGEAESCLPLFQ